MRHICGVKKKEKTEEKEVVILIRPRVVNSFCGYSFNDSTAYNPLSACESAVEFYFPNVKYRCEDITPKDLNKIERLLLFWNLVHYAGMTKPEAEASGLRGKLGIPRIVEAVVDNSEYDSVFLFLKQNRANHWIVDQPELSRDDIEKVTNG